MSYHDPYTDRYAQNLSSHHHYDASSDYNPYMNNTDPRDHYEGTSHYPDPSLDNSEHMSYPPSRQEPENRSTGWLTVEPMRRDNNGYEQGEFTAHSGTREKSLQGLKDYRYGHRGNLWTKGGRRYCVGRFCCCTIMTAVLLIVSVLLAVALWIRPPNIKVGNVNLASTNPLQIFPEQKELKINLGVNISVHNPNSFSINFKRIKADIFYPINNTHIGGGDLRDVVFKPNQDTNITFPFAIEYNAKDDPQYHVLTDLAQKCGVLNGAQSNIDVNYKITLGLRILFVTISPVISNSMSFACPAEPQQIKDFLQSVGITDPSSLGQSPAG
ncbi:hypothetical protein AX17_002901 [Amanita inopinata Kibby_2008]|nr:hypothetical protein AX17_002901 [Amanita inopinata Kibby_2008]